MSSDHTFHTTSVRQASDTPDTDVKRSATLRRDDQLTHPANRPNFKTSRLRPSNPEPAYNWRIVSPEVVPVRSVLTWVVQTDLLNIYYISAG